MNKKYVMENIFVIENFLTQDEIDHYMGVVNDKNIPWETISYPNKETIWTDNEKLNFIDKDKEILGIKIQQVLPEYNFNWAAGVQRRKVGQSMEVHTDDPTDRIKYGIIVYLNDTYEGGELHYPDYNFTYKPKAGDLVCHPSDYRHEALKVISGTDRYFFSAFAVL
jgi:hypothetical protein